jgi:hypothetical protein
LKKVIFSVKTSNKYEYSWTIQIDDIVTLSV